MILKATGYNSKGDAITTFNNKVFYVRGLIIGEEAECEITKEEVKWGIAKIVAITKKSPRRNSNIPNNYLEIGGYEIMHMNQEEQIDFKTNKIIEDFKRNSNYDIKLSPIFLGEKRLRYRNKITLHDGAFHKRGTSEKIYLDDFLLTDIVPSTNIKGDVIIRKLDSIIIGKKGTKNIKTSDTILGMKFQIDLNAFYQVNKEVAEVAYKEILEWIPKDSLVFDFFSGIGTITLLASKKASKVIGVERNNYSHLDAIKNREINNVENAFFRNEDVFQFTKRTNDKPDVIIVDPAREGLKKNICKMLLKIAPKRIIYLSCNPGTQAADFNRLKEKYKIVYAKPFDMFPQTYHVENLIVLDREEDL